MDTHDLNPLVHVLSLQSLYISSSIIQSLFTSWPVATSMAVNTVPDALWGRDKQLTLIHILNTGPLKFVYLKEQ